MSQLDSAVYNLIIKNKIFCRCPECQKYLCLMEMYNGHCSECGNIDKDKILLIDLFNQKSDI